LEGSTIQGSSGDTGAIFKLTPSVNGKTWTESVIYNGPQLETGVVIFGASGENPLGIISGDSTSPGIFFMLTKPAAVAKGVARPAVSGRPITYAPGYKFVDSLSLSAGPSS